MAGFYSPVHIPLKWQLADPFRDMVEIVVRGRDPFKTAEDVNDALEFERQCTTSFKISEAFRMVEAVFKPRDVFSEE